MSGQIEAEPQVFFDYPRDPHDGRYVDLTVATGALRIVSNDKDLLDLMSPDDAHGKTLRLQHPTFRVLTPAELLRELSPPPSDDLSCDRSFPLTIF